MLLPNCARKCPKEEDISYNAVESEAYWTQSEQIFVASSTISVVTVGTATLNVLLFSLIFSLDYICLYIGKRFICPSICLSLGLSCLSIHRKGDLEPLSAPVPTVTK